MDDGKRTLHNFDLTGLNPRNDDEKERCRFWVHLILGSNIAILEDRKFLPVHRWKDIELGKTLTKENIGQVFADLAAAMFSDEMRKNDEIKPDDTIAGITYPVGTEVIKPDEGLAA